MPWRQAGASRSSWEVRDERCCRSGAAPRGRRISGTSPAPAGSCCSCCSASSWCSESRPGWGRRRKGWPRFVFVELHRTLALFAVALLALHVVTAILDPFVTIGWAATVLPFLSPYRAWQIGLGTLAVDVAGAVIITSLLRVRLGFRAWRAVHWLAYVAWPVAFVHSITSGTDLTIWWVALTEWASAAAVAVAVVARILFAARGSRRPRYADGDRGAAGDTRGLLQPRAGSPLGSAERSREVQRMARIEGEIMIGRPRRRGLRLRGRRAQRAEVQPAHDQGGQDVARSGRRRHQIPGAVRGQGPAGRDDDRDDGVRPAQAACLINLTGDDERARGADLRSGPGRDADALVVGPGTARAAEADDPADRPSGQAAGEGSLDRSQASAGDGRDIRRAASRGSGRTERPPDPTQ